MTNDSDSNHIVSDRLIELPEKFGQLQLSSRSAKSILNKASGFINAYDFTLNPYQGCQYGCSYCYAAAFSPDAHLRQEWGNWVIVKENAVELLVKELNRWQKKHPDQPPSIYMSSVTDPYQPLEAKVQLTRQLLKVMVNYQPTLVIQTRSPMITRDIDILKQFHRLRVNMSIPTGSEGVRKDFEPRSPSISARFQAMGKLKHNIPFAGNHEAKFSITITPLLPTFPDDQSQFIQKLEIADRVVIQDFHASDERSLVASTRSEAIALQQKYAWWYNRRRLSYQNFKHLLTTKLSGVEVMEGKTGFGYD